MYINKMHENIVNLMSYGAILNFIIDNRNSGKTTQFKKRALKRALKHHTLTVWCRRFENEFKECKREFLNDKFFKVLEKDYKSKFKREDFKINGNYAYYKNIPFVYFIYVAKAKADKGIDAENIDTIVYDEFMTDDAKYNYYRGDEVKDFFTIFFTKKRTHADGTQSNIYIYMLGNRDSFTNPYYTYFGLPTLDLTFTGIKMCRDGSIAVMQLNTPVLENKTVYDKKLSALLKNTSIEKYLNGGYLSSENMTFYKTPKTAVIYAQFDFGYSLSIYVDKNKFYAQKSIDKKRIVFTKKPNSKYKNNYVLDASNKKLFEKLINAYKTNQLYYDNEHTYYYTIKIFEYLNII